MISSVMNATSAKQKSEMAAWEEQVTACEHTIYIDQDPLFPEGIAFLISCISKPSSVTLQRLRFEE